VGQRPGRPPRAGQPPSHSRGGAVDWLTRLTAVVLRYSEPLLPPERRTWTRALRAEASQVPAGWDRLSWLAGGMRLTIWQAALRSVVYPLAFAAAAAGTAWSAWSGPPGDSAIMINRVDAIAIAAVPASLPWAVRRARGPIAGSWQAG
jgi:hypothetical protein